MSTSLQPFHLAFPVTDLEKTRHFFVEMLGCSIGRTDSHWIDFNLYGHQITAHLVDDMDTNKDFNEVDSKQIPARHFGVILTMDGWNELAERLKSKNADFMIEPVIRFKGEVGEQATLFIRDPSGNALEFKAFADPSRIFAS